MEEYRGPVWDDGVGALIRLLMDAPAPMAICAMVAPATMRPASQVARDGKVLDFSLARTSGDRDVDDSALEAVRSVGKLDPLPRSRPQASGRHSSVPNATEPRAAPMASI